MLAVPVLAMMGLVSSGGCGKGCGSNEPTPAAAPSPAPADTQPAAAAPAFVSPRESNKAPAVTEVVGTSQSLQVGATLAPRAAVELGDREQVVVSFEKGTKLQVKGPALFASATDFTDGLLLERGLARIDLPEGPLVPRSGFSLTTPVCRLALTRGGQFVVRVAADHGVSVASTAGSAYLHVASPEKQESEVRVLTAGQQATIDQTGRVEVRSGGALLLDQAELEIQARPAGTSRTKAETQAEQLDKMVAQQMVATRGAQEEQHAAEASAAADAGKEAKSALASASAALSRARGRLQQLLLQHEAARLTASQGPNDPGAAGDPVLEAAAELLPVRR